MPNAGDRPIRIHITGASGVGTSTLGRELASILSCPHYDTDTYYWLPTSPPFIDRRPLEQRLTMMRADLTTAGPWILSGSLDGWGDPLIPLFNAVIFLTLDNDVRVQRLRDREFRNHGNDILEGGPLYEKCEAFIKWASAYETGELPGRSRPRHEKWLSALPCPVIRLDNARDVGVVAQQAVAKLQNLNDLKRTA